MRRLALRREKLIVVLAVALFAVVMFRNAWLSDDAYITFRTIDNFVHGYGLNWNVVERVQAYTHPLWMLAVTAAYIFTGEIFYTSLFLSMLVSLIAILWLAFELAEAPGAAVLGVTILACSKAFVDYTTSGLENPLTYLLLALFLWLYLRSGRSGFSLKALFWLALIAGLATLNRIDTLLLLLPPLGYAWLFSIPPRTGGSVPSRFAVVLIGFTPFILWECFSLFYYGLLFPNTAYAKLNTGIGQTTLLNSGLYYLLNSLRSDPLTLLVIIVGVLAPFISRETIKMPVALGALLYLFYIVKIGGDFMSGRFLAAPLFVAATLLALSVQRSTFNVQWVTLPVWPFIWGIVLLIWPVFAPFTFI
jgi:arabinofuranosyltransferase